MSEVERDESLIAMRHIALQGKGHGPVEVRSPGLRAAKCLHPGCGWTGFDRGLLPSADAAIEADGLLHLQDVADRDE